jgi:hypothetical protein
MREGDTVTYAECLATLVHRAGSSRRLPVPGFHAGPRQIVVRIERLLDRAYSRSRRFGAGIAVTAGAVLLLAVTGVGNTVPVISDAIAPVAPAAPTPPTGEPKLVAPIPKIAAPLPKPVAAVPKTVTPLPALVATKPANVAPPAPPQSPAPLVFRFSQKTVNKQLTQIMHDMTTQKQPQYEIVMVHDDPAVTPVAGVRRSDSLIEALAAAGYAHLSVDELVSLTDSGINGHSVAEYARIFGHPSVDELTELAHHGVSPGYVQRVEAAGLHSLTVHDAIRLADSGVSPRDVSNALRILRSPPSIDDIIRLHNSGVE